MLLLMINAMSFFILSVLSLSTRSATVSSIAVSIRFQCRHMNRNSIFNAHISII